MAELGPSDYPTATVAGSSLRIKLKAKFRLFERCSGGLLNLRFNSSILESYYIQRSISHSLFRFRMAVSYFALVCLTWLIFFAITRTDQWVAYVSGAAIGLIMAIILFCLTYSKIIFEKHFLVFYIIVALFFSLLFLLPFAPSMVGVSPAFNSSLLFQLLLIMYMNIPLRLWQVILVCGPVSIIHVVLSCTLGGSTNPRVVCVYILMHCCVHMIGFLHNILSQVRRRSTFMRLGHSALMRKALEQEQRTQNEMIQSLMPQKVAREVMQGSHDDDESGGGGYSSSQEGDDQGDGANNNMSMKKISKGRSRSKVRGGAKKNKSTGRKKKVPRVAPDDTVSVSDDADYGDYSTLDQHEPLKLHDEEMGGQTPHAHDGPPRSASAGAVVPGPSPSAGGHAVNFRKFHVSQMENVSILFADIVGFTNMSSNKTASQLVFLLNDLFGRFDSLCELNLCEKIATLGDCYYCVSGCPNAVNDHAERIVEMGRSMCVAIQQFDEDHSEQVNMRVGVHTGKVICGLVGTRRFKFDVWSNDVTLANQMESSGKAGKVHISETTLEFVKDIYEVSDGEPVPDIRKVKVLIEYFNKEDQRYAIKHTQDQALIQTYFIERRFDDKPIVVFVPRTEVSPQSNLTDGGGSGVEPSGPVTNLLEVTAAASNELTFTTTTTTKTAKTAAVAGGASDGGGGGTITEVKARGSDVEMLEALSNVGIFEFPPISPFSLCFLDNALETIYRRQVLRVPRPSIAPVTPTSPRLTPVVNGLVNFIFFVAVCAMCFVNFPNLVSAEVALPIPFIIFGVGLLLHTIFVTVIIMDTLAWNGFCRCVRHPLSKVYRLLFNWFFRNIFGALMLCIPAAFILANFQLCVFWLSRGIDAFSASSGLLMGEYRIVLGLLFSFMLFNLTMFPTLSSWTKNLSATVISLLACLLMHCPPSPDVAVSCPKQVASFWIAHGNDATAVWLRAAESSIFSWEMTVILFLNLVLIFFLNRDIDISCRASFNTDFEASRAKKDIAKEKKQGEWLLQNIIPRFVLTDLRKTSKYSEHVKDASVMFATIANFAEFYDEQYQGGQEMLRVLNEIFADFEHLLSSAKFKDVEKIKTIAECFMAASGLNMVQRARNTTPDAHIVALMDFAIELIKTLDDFNRQMFNFHFELKIGFNIGEVTAGVIGTTKLLYDIWGDTVNVASRMYSTGQKGRIQVTEDVAQRLSSHYDFEYRGNVFVKGKGEMRTHLLVGRKGETTAA